MKSVNQAQLLGHVGSDPEVRTTQSGTKVANVSLATNHRVRRGEDWEDQTAWHRLTLFGRLAEVVEEYVRKGDRLFVEGRIDYSESKDAEGNVRYFTAVIVSELVLLGSASCEGRPEGPRGGGKRETTQRRQAAGRGASMFRSPGQRSQEADDDLPF